MSNFKYKHIIWDWNGTLFDDAWLCVEIINKMLHKRDLAVITPEYYQRIFDFPLIEYYRKLGFDFSVEPFAEISTEFILEYERRRPECRLRAGARKALQRNPQNGVSQSILSASKQDYLEDAITGFNIGEMFTAVVGLDNHHALGKVEIARDLVATINLDVNEIILIGDTIHDYEVAKAIGVDCCLIPSGHQDYQRLASCGAKMIASFSELNV